MTKGESMKQISFRIWGEVRPKERPRASAYGGFARIYTTKRQHNNENWIAMEYQKKAEHDNFEGFGELPVILTVIFHEAIPSSTSKKKKRMMIDREIVPTKHTGDLDNRLKTLLDGLNHTNAWKDDCVVVEIHASRVYDDKVFTDVTLTEYQKPLEPEPLENIGKGDNELCL